MYSLLLLNGGVGTRIVATQPKQFIKVNGIPIFVYSLVVAWRNRRDYRDRDQLPGGLTEPVSEIVQDYAIQTPVIYVPAGPSRQASVRAMLEHATCEDVLIHESARPMVQPSDFRKLIDHEGRNVSLMLSIGFTVLPSTRIACDCLAHWIETAFVTSNRLKVRDRRLAPRPRVRDQQGLIFTEDATMRA